MPRQTSSCGIVADSEVHSSGRREVPQILKNNGLPLLFCLVLPPLSAFPITLPISRLCPIKECYNESCAGQSPILRKILSPDILVLPILSLFFAMAPAEGILGKEILSQKRREGQICQIPQICSFRMPFHGMP